MYMTSIEFEKLNEKKKHYRIVDDDTIDSLVRYYGLLEHGELLKFVKETSVKGDDTVR